MTSNEDSKKLSEERYSRFAENYVHSETHAKGYDLERLVEMAQPGADWQMLDVATGGGHTALKFAPHVQAVVASDLTENMLAAAEKFIRNKGIENITFRQADAENLPFEDGRFDLVTCRIAPHHFPDVQAFLNQCARVLVPGGLLLVQDHVLPEDEEAAKMVDGFEKLRDPSHNFAFSQNAWLSMVERAGLTIEQHEEITKRHLFRPWAERQGHGQKTLDELLTMADSAPQGAKTWMVWEAWGAEEASFVNHHILIAGRKK